MKIGIMVIDYSFKNGTERAVTNLANMLSKNLKYDIKIITTNFKDGKAQYELESKVRIENLNLQKLNKTKIENLKYYFQLIKFYKNFSKEYDILIGTTHMLNILGILFSNKKTKFIACEHMNFESLKGIMNIIRKKVYKYAFKVVVLTKNDAKNYKNFLKAKKIEIIPNSLSFSHDNKNELNNKSMISVGRLSRQKGYDMLLEAFSLINIEYPDWILNIYGEGELKKELIIKRNQLKLDKNVFFHGSTDNIKEKYLENSIYIMSSRWEGLPMVLLEAMSCGLPIISFNCPYGPSEVILEGKNGFLIEKENIKELAEKKWEIFQNNTLIIIVPKKY